MNREITQPVPQGNYRPAVRHNELIYTSGMTPRENGELKYSGKVESTQPLESYALPVQLATKNALTAVRTLLQPGEKITSILQLNVYINAAEDFTQHAKIADFSSALLVKDLGNAALGSRIAVGVATLPAAAPVEITLVAVVGK